MTDSQNNSKIMEEKIDRLEAHFRAFKKDAVIDRELNRDLRTALIGSSLNGNKGIVNLLDQVNKRLEDLEKEQVLYKDAFENHKWSVRAIVGAFITTFIIWFFNVKK